MGSMTLSLSPDLEALLRMGLAVLCGMAVGLNRAHHGNTPHPNRVRVHVLVGLSACLMVLAAGPDANARSRAIQGVAAGVGFLGAGEILVPARLPKHSPPEVRGLSSAASIWFTAALGVTVAASRPVLGLVALGLALITLSDRSSGQLPPPIIQPPARGPHGGEPHGGGPHPGASHGHSAHSGASPGGSEIGGEADGENNGVPRHDADPASGRQNRNR
jgi:putative Mg2+ transporter-C (MgtC) family protein